MARRLKGKVGKEGMERARELLGAVGLSKRLTHLPAQLSGGESQRVAIARALVNKPRIIIADEPTGNLDENTGEEVMELLLTLCKDEGSTLSLVTHNPNFAKMTDRQVLINHGKLEE